jgi:hypothetical protein
VISAALEVLVEVGVLGGMEPGELEPRCPALPAAARGRALER